MKSLRWFIVLCFVLSAVNAVASLAFEVPSLRWLFLGFSVWFLLPVVLSLIDDIGAFFMAKWCGMTIEQARKTIAKYEARR